MTKIDDLTIVILSPDRRSISPATILSTKFAKYVLFHQTVQPVTDFACERNLALKKVTTKWVMFVDSDEVVDKASVKLVDQLAKQDRFVAATIIRQDIFHRIKLKHAEGQQKILRLFQTAKGKFVRPVHEIAQVKGEIFDSQIKIYHLAHQNLTTFINKISFYAQVEAKYRSQQNFYLLLIQLLLYPKLKFIDNYFLKLGCLDGWAGLSYALMMSLHSLLVRIYGLEILCAKSTKS